MAMFWHALAAWAAVGANPSDLVMEDRVALVEFNHCYDAAGAHLFDQLIFYDWSAADSRFHVRAFRIVRDPRQTPARDWRRGDYEVAWFDGEQMHRVRAEAARETWTQHDPEVTERALLPKESRRGLQARKPPNSVTR